MENIFLPDGRLYLSSFKLDSLGLAIEIATIAHSGQYDWAGWPYITHPLRVMQNPMLWGKPIHQCVAVLHDVCEDCPGFDLVFLSKYFCDDVINALRAITKTRGEDYEEYIDRVCENLIASQVKLCDLEDNSSPQRESASLKHSGLDKHMKRMTNYTIAKAKIRRALDD